MIWFWKWKFVFVNEGIYWVIKRCVMGIFLYIVILEMCLILEFLCRSCNVYDFLIINVSFEYRNGILKELNVKGI